MPEFGHDIHRIIDPGTPELRHAEAMTTLALADPEADFSFLDTLKEDVFRIFDGSFPGFQRCDTRYHDLDHTTTVVLATARLIHGARVAGSPLDVETMTLCMASSWFHDIGLIRTEGETEGTGARHTVGHEKRSARFLSDYLAQRGVSEARIQDCRDMIDCTALAIRPGDIPFSSPDIRLAGFMVGTADILGQVAERTYLEKLSLLYREFEEAGIPGFSSELDLLRKTRDFYADVAKVRLDEGLDDTARFMRPHFKARLGVNEDFYAMAIERNIDYISQLTDACSLRLECFEANLQRKI